MFLAVAIILTLAISAVTVFNRLIKYRTLMKEAYSGIDVQLRRRHDLIPNIVDAVKGYMQYEKSLLEEITSIRVKAISSQDPGGGINLENSLSRSLKSVFAIAEAYPELKANQSILKLQQGLIDIEDQIQMSRRYYNGTVRNFNIAVESFPGNLMAWWFGFARAEFFEIEYATERQVPDVKFNN